VDRGDELYGEGTVGLVGREADLVVRSDVDVRDGEIGRASCRERV